MRTTPRSARQGLALAVALAVALALALALALPGTALVLLAASAAPCLADDGEDQ